MNERTQRARRLFAILAVGSVAVGGIAVATHASSSRAAEARPAYLISLKGDLGRRDATIDMWINPLHVSHVIENQGNDQYPCMLIFSNGQKQNSGISLGDTVTLVDDRIKVLNLR